MSEFKWLDTEQLRPIIEAFRALKWPATRADMRLTAERLGWSISSDRKRGMDLYATFPVDENRVDVLLRDDHVAEITIPVSDSLRSHRDDVQADLDIAFRALSDDVNDILGGGKAKTPGMNRYHWDLADSGRLAIQKLNHDVVFLVLSPWVAGIERGEERQGLDPSRPIGDHQESGI